MKILETNSQEHIAREREKRERYGGGTRAPKRVHTFKSNRGEGAEKSFISLFRGIFLKKEKDDRRHGLLLKRHSKSIALHHTRVSSRAVSLFVALTIKSHAPSTSEQSLGVVVVVVVVVVSHDHEYLLSSIVSAASIRVVVSNTERFLRTPSV